MNAPWRIELFGGLQLFGDHGVVVDRFQTRKTGALLGYLAYYKEKPVSRDVLADLFWPENDPEAARNSLRVALNSLRRQLEPPPIPPGGVLNADRATVRLNPQAITTDTAEFERALKAERGADEADVPLRTARLLQAVELYKGPLLSGWYEEWIDLEQARLAEVYAGALRRLTVLLFESRDYDRALEFAQRAVQSDPLREENHRHLMRLYAALGRPDAALKAFRALETVLQNEMNTPPSGVSRDLVKQIVAGAASGASAPEKLFSLPSRASETVLIEAPLPASQSVVPSLDVTDVPAPSPTNELTAAGSLPLQWTRFWGREPELVRLDEHLQLVGRNASCLVTLVGTGGVGKTRLAIEAAARFRHAVGACGIWFVPLDESHAADDSGDASDSIAAREKQIVLALRHVLPIPDGEKQPPDAINAAFIESVLMCFFGTVPTNGAKSQMRDPVLLILDGVAQTENGAAAAARLIAELVERAPKGWFRCVVTSRQRLNVAFEHTLLVDPLPVPPPTDATKFLPAEEKSEGEIGSAAPTTAPAHLLEVLTQYPSVALFVERAQAVRPDFQITPRNAYAIADLCRRCDGLPLALELAASWARLFTPAQMLERTRENCFALLTSERRDLPPRRRALQMVLEDSCDDLTPPMRTLLAVLSVFDGGWTLQAAQEVFAQTAAAAMPSEAGGDVLPLLDALQARSLISVTETELGLRFYLLQTTRCFACSLASEAVLAAARHAHAVYYARLAQTAAPYLKGTDAETWRIPLDDEQENFDLVLQAACASSTESAQTRGLEMAANLWRWWYARGRYEEGSRTLESLLARAPATQAASVSMAKAYHGAGRLALSRGRAARAIALFEKSLKRLGVEEEQKAMVATGLSRSLIAVDLAIAARAHGDWNAAQNALTLVLEEKRRAGDAWGVAVALSEWASAAVECGDAAGAQAAFARSAELRRALGDRWGAVEAEMSCAHTLALLGEPTCARAVEGDATREMVVLGDVKNIAASFLNLGYVASEQDDWETALPLLRDAVSLFRAENDNRAAALVLWLIARNAARHNEGDVAAAAAEDALTESQTELAAKGAAPLETAEKNGAFQYGAPPTGCVWMAAKSDDEPVGEMRVSVLAGQLLRRLSAL